MDSSSFPRAVSSRAFVAGVLTRLQNEQQRWLAQLEKQAGELPAAESLKLTRPSLRSAANRLRVVVLGPTKAGKSTLLNALLGGYVLPTNEGIETTRAVSVVHRQELITPQLLRSDGQILAEGDEGIAAWLHLAHANDRRRAQSKSAGGSEPDHLELHACMPGFKTSAAANSDGVVTEFIDIPGVGEKDPHIKAITAAQVSKADLILLLFKASQLQNEQAEKTADWLSGQRQDLKEKISLITCVINFQYPPKGRKLDLFEAAARELLTKTLPEADSVPILSVKADHALFSRLQINKKTIPESLNEELQDDFNKLCELDLNDTWLPKLEEYIIETVLSRSGIRLLQSQTNRIRKEIETNEAELSAWAAELDTKQKSLINEIKKIEQQEKAATAFRADSKSIRTSLEEALSQDLETAISKLEKIYDSNELAEISYYWEDDANKAHAQRMEYLTKNAIPVIDAWERKVWDVATQTGRQTFGVVIARTINTETRSYLVSEPQRRFPLWAKALTVGILHLFDKYQLARADFNPNEALKQRQKQILDSVCTDIQQKCAKIPYSSLIANYNSQVDRLRSHITRMPMSFPAKFYLEELDFLLAQAQAVHLPEGTAETEFMRNATKRLEGMNSWVHSTLSLSATKRIASPTSLFENMRTQLNDTLKTYDDFDAFCIDYYPDIRQRFSATMDRMQQTNLLFSIIGQEGLAEMQETLKKLGKKAAPRGLRRSLPRTVEEPNDAEASAPSESNAEHADTSADASASRPAAPVNDGKRAVSGPIEHPRLFVFRPFYRQTRLWITVFVVLVLLLIIGIGSIALPILRADQRPHHHPDTGKLRVFAVDAGSSPNSLGSVLNK